MTEVNSNHFRDLKTIFSGKQTPESLEIENIRVKKLKRMILFPSEISK